MIAEKLCKGCNTILGIEQFTKSKNVRDGYENKCKKCRVKQRKRYKNKCDACGYEFRASKKDTRFCNAQCQGSARRKRLFVNCSSCDSKVEIIKSKLGKQENYYCNQKCRTEHLRVLMIGENNPNYLKIDHECDGCGIDMKIIPSKKKVQKHIFCTNECYIANIGRFYSGENNPNYNHQEYKCSECDQTFLRIPSANRGEETFCSKECYINRLKKSEVKEIVTLNCPICNEPKTVWKSKLDYTTRVYCSRDCADIGISMYYSGKNSPNWNHGLTKEERIRARKYEEYYNWRVSIFSRDDYSCKKCGDCKGGNLVAHHILNYSEHEHLRTDITNGITLCNECHKTFHDTFGYTKNNREQLSVFLNRHD